MKLLIYSFLLDQRSHIIYSTFKENKNKKIGSYHHHHLLLLIIRDPVILNYDGQFRS